MVRRFAWIGVVAALLAAGCGRKGSEELAVVNGEPITMDQFVQYLKTKDRVRVLTNQGVVEAAVADTLAYQALEDLISRQLLLQLARDENVYPSEQEVIREIEFRKRLNPNFIQQLNARGMTIDRIKAELTVQLATEKLLTKGITVTDEDLDRFIKDNRFDVEPTNADLVWIAVRNEEAKKLVDQELSRGGNFALVAARYSEAPSAKETDARYNLRQIASILPPELTSAIEKTDEGKSTDWVFAGNAWSKVFVEKKTPERKLTLDADKRELYRRELAKLMGQRAKDLGKRLADKLFESEKRIVIQQRDLSEIWTKALERAKRERTLEVPAGAGRPEEKPSGAGQGR